MEGSSQNGPGGVNGSNGQSARAARFEDEKRRIIDSCFGKKDEDGSREIFQRPRDGLLGTAANSPFIVLESYITHIRIIEDAMYPSSAPPPNADPAAKKPRLVIVAVRKSGRVRMHKARENANGTFSIGKTWSLDDLSAVRSYNDSIPTTPEEEQQKEWAQGVGFSVTLGKPYYWQANTQKEKEFFIASLVKIYTKYTGGRSPELIGFAASERNKLLGTPTTNTSSQPPVQQSARPGYGQPQNQAPPRRELSRELRRQPSREPLPRSQMPLNGTPSLTSQTSRPQMRDTPNSSMDSNGATTPQPQNLRRLAGGNQSQESFGRSDDGSSLPPRSRGGLNGLPSAPGRFQDRSITPNSQRTVSSGTSSPAPKETADTVPPVPAPLTYPPERRRPPMPIIGDSRQRGLNSAENIVPAPLSSPGMRREDLQPPGRSSERTHQREREPVSKMASAQIDMSESPRVVDGPAEQNVATPTSDLPSTAPAIPLAEEPKSPEEEEEVRPGLGPMIKKKSRGDIAGQFMKAAKTANAFSSFKPRAGGAAERLRETQTKSSEGPDGISGVVPAPSLIRGLSAENSSLLTPPASISSDRMSSRKSPDSIPEVKITAPQSGQPSGVEGPFPTSQEKAIPEKPQIREVKRIKSPAETMAKELASLGIDPAILGGRGGELVAAWDEFGWVGDGIRTKNIDHMKEEVERELNKIQAGGWLKLLDEGDERIEAIKQGFDKVIEECDELDGLLTLYSVELSVSFPFAILEPLLTIQTLTDDIAYIEAQSQGLQVHAANQKLLQAELKSLLDTISISAEQLESLRTGSLENSGDIERIESSLVLLFKAMLTIDPSLGLSGSRRSEDGGSLSSGKPGGFGNSEIGSMRVLQEKKDVYKNEVAAFLQQRFKPFLQIKFAAAIDETRKALELEKGNNLTRAAGRAKLDTRHHDLARAVLWKYGPLMLFAREVDRQDWEDFLKLYEIVCRPLYQDEFRDAVFAWKRIARKPTGDENDLLFTSQIEKQTDGIATTARKLTVKRSQTLAKSLRSPIGDNASKSSLDKGSDGRLQPYEIFTGALDEIMPIMSTEQNFIVEFFHITTLEQFDFPESVALAPPDSRRGPDLRRPRVMEPNRDLAKLVVESMEEVFTFFPGDMQALVDWSIQADPLYVPTFSIPLNILMLLRQGVGVIAAIERKLLEFEESSQEYLARTLQKQHTRLVGLFTKFLDEQIRAIEDTKVKIKKRKGVISFIRIFPSFSLVLETMLVTAHDLEIRETVNRAYARINKTMFESLKVIARENPGANVGGADPEDKEALNYQILLIENMNHYLEEVDSRANPVLEDWKQNAVQEMDEHMSLYLGAVIRRPLGKLLDFLESTESLMLSRQPGDSFAKIAAMPSHSKSTFRKVLASYDSKEIRKGIEALKKRVEKHFGDADDPGLSRGLVAKVTQNCEKFYEKVEDRILTISRDVYDGEVIAEWNRADVSTAFRGR